MDCPPVSRLDKQNHEWERVVNSSIMEEGNNGLKQRLGRVAAHMSTERLIFEISQVVINWNMKKILKFEEIMAE